MGGGQVGQPEAWRGTGRPGQAQAAVQGGGQGRAVSSTRAGQEQPHRRRMAASRKARSTSATWTTTTSSASRSRGRGSWVVRDGLQRAAGGPGRVGPAGRPAQGAAGGRGHPGRARQPGGGRPHLLRVRGGAVTTPVARGLQPVAAVQARLPRLTPAARILVATGLSQFRGSVTPCRHPAEIGAREARCAAPSGSRYRGRSPCDLSVSSPRSC